METSISREKKKIGVTQLAFPSAQSPKGKKEHKKSGKFELFLGNPIMENLHYSFFCTASCLFSSPGPLNSRVGRYHLIFRQSVFALFQFSLLSLLLLDDVLMGKRRKKKREGRGDFNEVFSRAAATASRIIITITPKP